MLSLSGPKEEFYESAQVHSTHLRCRCGSCTHPVAVHTGAGGRDCGPAAAETGGIPIDPAHFPDANFLKYVEKIIDTDHSGTLSQEERNATVIYVLGRASKT